jgi:AcrR family transcriptional regulator
MSEISTKERILDAAEDLFAEEGFATSLRAITARAGVNLASVNYHFGSKDALIREVFARRLVPLNDERLSALAALESAAPGAGPPLEGIIEAFVGPAIRMSHDPRGATFTRLFGRTMSQRDDRILRLFTGQFRTIIQRFSEALARALPNLDRNEVVWRMLFVVGAMAHTMALSDKLPVITGGACDPSDVEATVRRLVPFLAAGMRAAAPARAGGVGR